MKLIRALVRLFCRQQPRPYTREDWLFEKNVKP